MPRLFEIANNRELNEKYLSSLLQKKQRNITINKGKK